MSEQIRFQFGISKLFRTAKCINVPAGDYLDIAAALDNAESFSGSDTLVVSKEILFVLAGSFEIHVPDLPTPLVLNAGDNSPGYRYRSAHQIVATSDGSSYVCVTPRDDVFWQREAAFVSAGDQITIETPAEATDAYIFVATGSLRDDQSDILVGALVPVSGNTVLTGVADSHFVHLWK